MPPPPTLTKAFDRVEMTISRALPSEVATELAENCVA